MEPRDDPASSTVSLGVWPGTGREVVSADEPVARALARLEPVLIARYGVHVGQDLVAEVRAYAWEHGDDLRRMANPAGYLYRVAQSASRRYRRWQRHVVLPHERSATPFTSEAEVRLHEALARLGPNDRTIVVLVHSYGYSYGAAADLMGLSPGSVRNRLHRAMARLRSELGEETHRAHG